MAQKVKRNNTKKAPSSKAKRLSSKLAALDRRLALLLLVIIGTAGYFSYVKMFPDTVKAEARAQADMYMQSIVECDYQKHVKAKFGLDATGANTEDRAKFLEGCKEMKSYSHIKTAKGSVDEAAAEKFMELEGEDLEDTENYWVDYLVKTKDQSERMVTRIVVMKTEGQWYAMPGPGFPVTEEQYNRIP